MTTVLLTLAMIAYGSSIWGALAFFRVSNRGARAGKRWIGLGAGISTVVTVCLLSQCEPTALQFLAAAACYALSIAVFWWTVLTCKRTPLDFAFSEEQPARLITTGPYRLVRHPFYCSYLLGWAAALVAVPGLMTACVLAGMAVLYRRAAMKEERLFLLSPLGADYARYQHNTGRFLPVRSSRTQSAAPGRFDSDW